MNVKNAFLILGISLVLLLLIFIISLGFGQLGAKNVKDQVLNEEIKKVEKVPEQKISETTKVPILMYHYVRNVDKNEDLLGWNLSVSPELFEKQLAWLKEKKYVSIHLADLVDGAVPEHAVLLSFDDGLEDFYSTALPLLKKYGFTASNSVVTEMIGTNEHMSLEQIQACVDAGIEITSHSLSHADMSTLSGFEVRRQVAESRDFLNETFGLDIVGFVYPSGKYNSGVVKVLEEEGYKIAVTTEFGEADLAEDSMLLLPRVRIDNRDGFDGFVKKLKKF